ncbi:MAG: hypothetical protein RL651_1458 [Pseudomonadota bacterium]
MLDPNAPGRSVEIGIADDTVQIKSSQDRYRHRYFLAALDAATGSLVDTEAAPEHGLVLVQVVSYVGNMS